MKKKFKKKKYIIGNELKFRLSVFFKRSKFYRKFKFEQKRNFRNFFKELKENFNLSIFSRKGDNIIKYIIKLLFLFHLFNYIWSNFVKFYRLCVNCFFDFCMVTINVFSYRYHILYYPSVRWDVERLRRTFLFVDFEKNFKNLFIKRRTYRLNNVVVKEKWHVSFVKIIFNFINFFIYQLPIIFSFLSVIFRYFFLLFDYYFDIVYCTIVKNLFVFIIYIYSKLLFFYFFPLRFKFKIRSIIRKMERKKKKRIYISSIEFENIIELIEKNNIDNSNIVKEFFSNLSSDVYKDRYLYFDSSKYKNYLNEIKKQKKILLNLKLINIERKLVLFFSKIFYVYYFFNFLFHLVIGLYKWIKSIIKLFRKD